MPLHMHAHGRRDTLRLVVDNSSAPATAAVAPEHNLTPLERHEPTPDCGDLGMRGVAPRCQAGDCGANTNGLYAASQPRLVTRDQLLDWAWLTSSGLPGGSIS